MIRKVFLHGCRIYKGPFMQRIAVIGSGISGLAAAVRLASSQTSHQVCLFEAGSHFGGHAHTVDMCLDGIHPNDEGHRVLAEAALRRANLAPDTPAGMAARENAQARETAIPSVTRAS